MVQSSRTRGLYVFLKCIVFIIFLVPGVALAQNSVSQSHISIVKIPSLQLQRVRGDEVYFDSKTLSANSTICLGTSGQTIPFRIVALSESALNEIPYDTFVSENGEFHKLHQTQDNRSPVFRAASSDHCDAKTLIFKMNQELSNEDTSTQTVDKITVMFIIE